MDISEKLGGLRIERLEYPPRLLEGRKGFLTMLPTALKLLISLKETPEPSEPVELRASSLGLRGTPPVLLGGEGATPIMSTDELPVSSADTGDTRTLELISAMSACSGVAFKMSSLLGLDLDGTGLECVKATFD